MSFHDANGIAIPFGKGPNGQLVHISNAPRGKTDLICPGCGTALIARQSSTGKRVWHFAHAAENCGAGLESAAHLFAKQTIQNHRQLNLPEYIYHWKELNRKVRIYESMRIRFEEVRLEQSYNSLRPDVTCITESGKTLYVEIVVTNGISEEKFQKIKANKLTVLKIEITRQQIGKMFDQANLEALEDEIIEGLIQKKWAFNVPAQLKVSALRRQYHDALRQYNASLHQLLSRYTVLNEPLYANILDVPWEIKEKLWRSMTGLEA